MPNTDEIVKFVANRLSRVYVENTWVTGQCANLAFGISQFLSELAVPHQLKVDGKGNHVWIQVGRVCLDADKYGVCYSEGKPVVLDREHELKDTAAFRQKYRILLTPRRIAEVYKDFKRAWEAK
jgi:hypothetical protein